MTTTRWTVADLEALPQPVDDTRYEIIDGELFVSTQPSLEHQYACGGVHTALAAWGNATGLGVVFFAPGLIFADDDNAAPDVVWLSQERFRTAAWADGKLHEAPELVVEVLSPGADNVRRDRQAKVGLYSRRGVLEYWIADWQLRLVDVYRREGDVLRVVATLRSDDRLQSPLLPGFAVPVDQLFLPQGL